MLANEVVGVFGVSTFVIRLVGVPGLICTANGEVTKPPALVTVATGVVGVVGVETTPNFGEPPGFVGIKLVVNVRVLGFRLCLS